ncbi:hypothetical protein KSS87_006460 [Heliosperma pusillum]|nr:hypothetical protein KSS87_002818 [Heliosperma pusillum]KAH9620489.1 hypothetical protein KSS87_006460 [Heliosperma pusillum]
MAASCRNPDIWSWIQTLPPLNQWKSDSMSICICSSNSSSANLSLSIAKNSPTQSITLSIFASFSLPISLWTSNPIYQSTSLKLLDEQTTYNLISNFIQDVLKYGPFKQAYPLKIPIINPPLLKDFFNFSFITLAFLVCIYEAPFDLRSNCLVTLKDQLMTLQSRDTSKLLMRHLGSNTEEQWMRCLSLAVTNWKNELKAMNHILKGRCPLFSYSFSTTGLWKVHVYCPIITMEIENSSGSADEQLAFSLNYHQLEGVIQLNPTVTVRDKWIEVNVNVDNLRLDVVRLVSEALLNDRGAGASEKHFPSRISLQLTPICQTNIIGITVSKSSENPEKGIEIEKSLEFSFEPPKSMGIQVTTGETTTTTFKPWNFEQTAVANTARFNWSLYDSNGGREVFSLKPSPIKLIQPKAWFKHRYSNINRPFTRQGGVVFARDEYGQSVCWKVDKAALGKTLDWDISGCIGLTYWPNKYRTFYNETRRAEFRETLQLTLG